MKEILIYLCVIKHIANNLHYRSSDEWFYALHLLADKLDFGSAEDDIKEAYYLGFLEQLPPDEKEIVQIVNDALPTSATDNAGLIAFLHDYCAEGIVAVEEAKREAGLPGGVHAILDGVSQKMLTIKGLCWRSLNGGNRTDQ